MSRSDQATGAIDRQAGRCNARTWQAIARFLCASAALASVGCTYTTRVSGSVQDDQAEPVQAEIVLELDGGGRSPRVLADGNGHFVIEREEICLLRCFGPAPRLVVRKAGFKPHEVSLQRFAHVDLAIILQRSP